MRLFRNRGFSGAVLADLLTILGLSGLVFFLSQYLQLVQGRGPLEAGLAELPAAVGAVAAGLVAGTVARRYSVRAVVSGGLAAIGLALARADPARASPPAIRCSAAALLVVGVGAGFSFTVTADVILSSVPRNRRAPRPRSPRRRTNWARPSASPLLGSIVTGVYRDFTAPAGTPPRWQRGPRVTGRRGGGRRRPCPTPGAPAGRRPGRLSSTASPGGGRRSGGAACRCGGGVGSAAGAGTGSGEHP